ncbi:PqqD family protein [Actinopolyspora mortivallis]|uniref:PqqD family protein n=1 Tax=Actinopolyspora mortivallis TaxID=33906 RepID=UPI00036407E9|nr:PqqD family protein [Actinopolyspora mortivallis]
MRPDARPCQTPVTTSPAGTQWVLIPDSDEAAVVVVNDTGYRVLAQCDGTRSLREITETIAVGTNITENEVSTFLDHVHRCGLVTLTEHSTPCSQRSG